MKRFQLVIPVLVMVMTTIASTAQSRYEVSSGNIDLTSNAALELINATSEKVKGFLDSNQSSLLSSSATGRSRVLIVTFKDNTLMRSTWRLTNSMNQLLQVF